MKKFLSIFLIITLLTGFSAFATDVDGHWAEAYVKRLQSAGIMQGYEDGTFRPDGTVTRAEFVTMLVRLVYDGTGLTAVLSDKPFADVSETDWYYPYVCAAVQGGFVVADADGTFRPSDAITREEMVVMITLALELSGGACDFSDIPETYPHYDAVSAAVEAGILTGYEDGTFRPLSTATRGETAAMVCRMIDYREGVQPPATEPEQPPVTEPEQPADRINMTWHQIYNKDVTKTGNHMNGLDVISPTWFRILDNTGLTPYSYEHVIDPDTNLYLADLGNTAYIEDAKDLEGYQVWAMLKTDFTVKTANKFLNSDTARKNCIDLIEQFIGQYRLDGINLDFENMYVSDKDQYTLFVKEMSEMCKRVGVVLSVDVTKYDPTGGTWSMCFDRAAIAQYADYVALMAYDENGTWSKKAGSVASLPWVERSIQTTLEEVPAEKLLLGIPFYARLWVEENGTVVKTYAYGMRTIAQKIAEAGAQIVYDEATGQNYAEWRDGNSVYKVWIEDKTSIQARLDLVEKYNLAGVASWSKTFETADIWDYIEENLR